MIRLLKKKILTAVSVLTLLLFSVQTMSQDCGLRVSLLTCSPGEELYSTFGHTAIRIIDSTSGRDLIFNYGTFNFEEPNFYGKFIRGKLEYFVSVDDYASFEYEYQLENRSITEQLLDLTCEEKQKLKEFLQWNMLPANRYYKYDFTFDNCTTRPGDIIEKITNNSIQFKPFLAGNMTFRNAIHEYLDLNEKSWSKLGIDILLGSRLDREMTLKESMFLPDNLMLGLDSATVGNQRLVADKEVILKKQYVPHTHNNITNPLFIFSCLFVLIAFLSFSNNKKMERFLAALDGFLFFINGAIGVLLLFMWFGTDHFMTKDNYNLLWAWPTNIVAAFFVHSTHRWVKYYFILFALAQILLIGLWFFLPQNLNLALIPVNGILIFRSFLYNPLNRRIHGRNTVSE